MRKRKLQKRQPQRSRTLKCSTRPFSHTLPLKCHKITLSFWSSDLLPRLLECSMLVSSSTLLHSTCWFTNTICSRRKDMRRVFNSDRFKNINNDRLEFGQIFGQNIINETFFILSQKVQNYYLHDRSGKIKIAGLILNNKMWKYSQIY